MSASRLARDARGFFLHDFPPSITAHVHHRTAVGHVVVEGGRQPTRSVHRAPSYTPTGSKPSHPRRLPPAAGDGMLRPRLRFGITSTSSTSRLITLSEVAAAVTATTVVVVVVVAEKRLWKWPKERQERRRRSRRRRKKIMKWTSERNRGIIIRAPTTGVAVGADSVSLYKLGAVRYKVLPLREQRRGIICFVPQTRGARNNYSFIRRDGFLRVTVAMAIAFRKSRWGTRATRTEILYRWNYVMPAIK